MNKIITVRYLTHISIYTNVRNTEFIFHFVNGKHNNIPINIDYIALITPQINKHYCITRCKIRTAKTKVCV